MSERSFHYVIYSKVKDIPDSWDAFKHNDTFLKRPFLTALEESAPSNITSYYIGIFNETTLVAIVVVQRVEMYLKNLFRDNTGWLKQSVTHVISKIAQGNILVLGNLMHTGQHGYCLNSESISNGEFLSVMKSVFYDLSKRIKSDFGKKIRLLAFKDYFEDAPINLQTDFFRENGLYGLNVQPNMVFTIPENWDSISFYKEALTRKYRQRYNSALKKLNGIDAKVMSLEDIDIHSKRIYKLYKTVSDNAKVNSFLLDENHFYTLKKELKDNFELIGYFKDEVLVGFFSLIKNGTTLETYFLGYNKLIQKENQLYLNMLYTMLDYGITHRFKQIVFARTALEIKSSIGAIPKPMLIYVKHTNHYIANMLIKFIFKYMSPVKPWEQRNPFKIKA